MEPTPRQLGPYVLGEILGEGGMGRVYRARHEGLARWVALKTLLRANDEQASLDRFQRETQIMSQLSHRNVVKLYDAGVDGETVWLAMELVTGETLKAKLARTEKGLPQLEMLSYARDGFRGLVAIHELGVLHRDIKPGNLFVTAGGTVKLMDFGLAKDPKRTALTGEGDILGTVGFLPPEMLRGEDCDLRGDIYQMGIVCYRMLTGRSPYPGDSVHAYLASLASGKVVSPRKFNDQVSVALDGLVMSCISIDPGSRPATAVEIVKALDHLKALSGRPTPPSGPTYRPVAPRPARSRRTAGIAASLVVAGCASAAWLLAPVSPVPARLRPSGASSPGTAVEPEVAALWEHAARLGQQAESGAARERLERGLAELVDEVERSRATALQRSPEAGSRLVACAVLAVEEGQESSAHAAGLERPDDALASAPLRGRLASSIGSVRVHAEDRKVPNYSDAVRAVALGTLLTRGQANEPAEAIELLTDALGSLSALRSAGDSKEVLAAYVAATVAQARAGVRADRLEQAGELLWKGLSELERGGDADPTLARHRLRLTVPLLEIEMRRFEYGGEALHRSRALAAFVRSRDRLSPWLERLSARRPGWREMFLGTRGGETSAAAAHITTGGDGGESRSPVASSPVQPEFEQLTVPQEPAGGTLHDLSREYLGRLQRVSPEERRQLERQLDDPPDRLNTPPTEAERRELRSAPTDASDDRAFDRRLEIVHRWIVELRRKGEPVESLRAAPVMLKNRRFVSPPEASRELDRVVAELSRIDPR